MTTSSIALKAPCAIRLRLDAHGLQLRRSQGSGQDDLLLRQRLSVYDPPALYHSTRPAVPRPGSYRSTSRIDTHAPAYGRRCLQRF